MALPSDRNSLVRFCLQELGAPVIEINLDEQQIENQVDKALEVFKEYHVDGTGIFFKAFKITGSTLKLQDHPSKPFAYRELFKGKTSKALGQFHTYDESTKTITFTNANRVEEVNFIDGEEIEGNATGAVATLATDTLTVGLMDKKYLELPDSVVGIIDILKSRTSFGTHPINPFDLQYQLAQQVTIHTFLNADVVTYYMYQQDIELWNQLFVGTNPYWHARKQNRLYIHSNWPEEFRINQYLLVKFWGAINPQDFPKVYGDKWIRKYLTALLQVQWGRNLTKFVNVTLPGGITLNGQDILAQGEKHKEEAEIELRLTYEQRTPFKIG